MKPAGTAWFATVASPSMIRSTMSSWSTASEIASRTRASANGFASSAEPSFAEVSGAGSATVLNCRKIVRADGPDTISTSPASRSRATSSGGTSSMTSTSPDRSAATRAAPSGISRITTDFAAGAPPQ